MKAQFSHVQWGRVLQAGILVVILDFILGLVWGLLAIQAHIAFQVFIWGTYILEFLLIVGGGIWVARKVESAAPLHGFLVGLIVALISFLFSFCSLFSGQSFGSFVLVVLGYFVLDVAGGWLGGVLGSRGREKS